MAAPLPSPFAPSGDLAPRVRPILDRMGKLPVLPANYQSLLRELEDPMSDADSIARVLQRDPAMAAKILSVANSAAFGFVERITALTEAVKLLGLAIIKSLVLTDGIFRDIGSGLKGPLSQSYLWNHAFNTAILSRNLMRRLEPPQAESAFMAGLLHDMGKLVLSVASGDRYYQILVRSQSEALPLPDLELVTFGATHAEVGAYLFETWNLPASIISAVRWHHLPSRVSKTKFNLATAAHVADALEYYAAGDPPFTRPPLESAHLAALRLPEDPEALRRLTVLAVD